MPLIGAVPAMAQEADKSGYTLFNPTPRELWRPFESNRPGISNSPRSIDAGAVQIESTIFQFGYDSHNGTADRTTSFLVADTVLRIGVLNNADFQFIWTPYQWEETKPDGATATTVSDGPGDLTLRLQVNIFGNDSGPAALGAMPYITIPTGSAVSDDHVLGGVAVPFEWVFSEHLQLSAMAQFASVYSDVTANIEASFQTSVALNVTIYGPLDAWIEIVGEGFTGGLPYEASASLALTCMLADDVMLDVGTLIGLTKATEDLVAYTGITIRF